MVCPGATSLRHRKGFDAERLGFHGVPRIYRGTFRPATCPTVARSKGASRCPRSLSVLPTFFISRPGGSRGPSLLCIPCHSMYIWVVAQPRRCGLLCIGFYPTFVALYSPWDARGLLLPRCLYISLAGVHACAQQLSPFPVGGSRYFFSRRVYPVSGSFAKRRKVFTVSAWSACRGGSGCAGCARLNVRLFKTLWIEC